MLGRIAASYEPEPGRCQDLLQEISLAIWKALPRWRGEASLRTFVARVAHNRSIDHLGHRLQRAEDELDEHHADPIADPLATTQAEQRRARLIKAVQRLPVGQRQVVVLALEGFTQIEIGQALALEENTVAQRLGRARKQLRDWLDESQ